MENYEEKQYKGQSKVKIVSIQITQIIIIIALSKNNVLQTNFQSHFQNSVA